MSRFEADNLLDEALAAYLDDFVGDSPSPARQMEEDAARTDFPIVGPVVGRTLKMVSGLIEPACLLELGSGFGYSAYWFGEGTENCEIHLTDFEAEKLDRARDYLGETDQPDKFHYHEGNALDLFESFEGSVDLLFVDVDKTQYPAVLDLAETKLKEGTWLIADNVLWKGRVASSESPDEATRGVTEFNDRLAGPSWESVILPVRDGLMLARYEAG